MTVSPTVELPRVSGFLRLRFANRNADELSPHTHTTGCSFAKPCSTMSVVYSQHLNCCTGRGLQLCCYSETMMPELQTILEHNIQPKVPRLPLPTCVLQYQPQSAFATAVRTQRPFGKRSSVMLRVADRKRMRRFRAMRSETEASTSTPRETERGPPVF